MKTQGEIAAAVCEGMMRFEQEYMGRWSKHVHAHLIGDLLLVRLQGVLAAAEQQMVKSLPAEKGRNLLKQVRAHLVETARPVMDAMIQEVHRPRPQLRLGPGVFSGPHRGEVRPTGHSGPNVVAMRQKYAWTPMLNRC